MKNLFKNLRSMSKLETAFLLITSLSWYLVQFIPKLFKGIFEANNSNASGIYATGCAFIFIGCIFNLAFIWALFEDMDRRRR